MRVVELIGGTLHAYPLFMVLGEAFKLERFVPWHPQPSILYCSVIVALFISGLVKGRRCEDVDP